MERNLRVSRFRREQDGRLEGAGHEAREGAVAAGHGIEGVVGGTDGDARRYPAYEHIHAALEGPHAEGSPVALHRRVRGVVRREREGVAQRRHEVHDTWQAREPGCHGGHFREGQLEALVFLLGHDPRVEVFSQVNCSPNRALNGNGSTFLRLRGLVGGNRHSKINK